MVDLNARSEVPVLIVGGGPAGLVASLLLGRHGVPSILLERRSSTSILPRATGINLRTMEIFRSVGVADKIAAAAMEVRDLPLWVSLETLGGPVQESHRLDAPSGAPLAEFPSPVAHLQCAQDRVEPLLLEEVRRFPESDVRFGYELIGMRQDAGGVTAEVLERQTEQRYVVRAAYLIGADGANSFVRRALGICMSGQEHLGRELNVLFEADLSRLVRDHRATLYRVRNTEMEGIFRPVDDLCRWTLTTPYFGHPTAERCAQAIRAGAGDPMLEPRIIAVQDWELGAAVAETFRVGRVFLAGDAAHRLTPGGALGMNTAVQDVHNLAWKLSAVVKGWGGAGLLSSYDPERRPVAARNVALSLEIWNDMRRAGRTLGAVLGFTYDSSAIVSDGTPLPDGDSSVAEFVPTARPGSRAPHHWLQASGRRLSTIDLFDKTFVVLSPDISWCHAAEEAAESLHVPLVAHAIKDDDWAGLYGLQSGGAVLVRPDGHVAWRVTGDRLSNAAELNAVLRSILALQSAVDAEPNDPAEQEFLSL